MKWRWFVLPFLYDSFSNTILRFLFLMLILSGWLFPCEAYAQLMTEYFPSELPGYSSDSTASVTMRQYMQNIDSGIHVGDYIIRPSASQFFGYNTSILGVKNTSGAELDTSASLSANSNWNRHAVGMSMSVANHEFPTLSAANYTNWTASFGGSFDIGEDTASIGYSHYVMHLYATDLGNFGISYPVPYAGDDARVSYRKNWARFAVIPSASYNNFSFGQAGGTSTFAREDVRSLGHQLETQMLQGRFEISKGNALVAILRGSEAQFISNPGTVPSDYISGGGFIGLDMRASQVLQYRVLAGGETRQFTRSDASAITTPTAEADVIWMPDLMNTVTLTGQRGLFDPTSPFSRNQIMSTVRLQEDHELRRDVFLRGSAEMGTTDSRPSGNEVKMRTQHQTQFIFNASVNWKINRDFTASLSYSHITSYTKHGIASISYSSIAQSTYTSNTIMFGISFAR